MFPIESMPKELQGLVQLDRLFTHYRIVDTARFCVCKTPGKQAGDERCYQLWERQRSCQNCISRRALDSGEPVIKLETLQNRIFFVCSVALREYPGYVMELAADVTRHLTERAYGDPKLVNLVWELNHSAVQDPLTGLYNDRYLYRQLQEDIDHARLQKLSLSAAVLDIDHLSAVNDQYSRLAGDTALQVTAYQIGTCAKEAGGWAARLAGDEFLLVFRGAGRKEAESICGLLAERIAGLAIPIADDNFHITVTIGFGSLVERGAFGPSEDHSDAPPDKLAGEVLESLYRKLLFAKRIRQLEEIR